MIEALCARSPCSCSVPNCLLPGDLRVPVVFSTAMSTRVLLRSRIETFIHNNHTLKPFPEEVGGLKTFVSYISPLEDPLQWGRTQRRGVMRRKVECGMNS